MKKTRVVIVDDSPTIRGLLSAILQRDPEIEVVGSAGDPHQAREAIKTLNPDVITLDVEMPKMSGIEFLEKIMRLRPMPVIMVSTLTQEGASVSLEALELGAVDCVGKPDFDGLAEKVKVAARARIAPIGDRRVAPRAAEDFRPGHKIMAIGSSTGGVEALITMLSSFPKNCPPTVITQHMPPTFTASFAARLNKLCAPKVQEAENGMPLEVGQIYLAPGGAHHLEVLSSSRPACRLVESDLVNGHRPSVDVLFSSMARVIGPNGIGVILTGMGRDGAQGLLEMRRAGARTLGQDESSSIVYGMPRAAFELGAVEQQASISQIGGAALDACAARLKRAV